MANQRREYFLQLVNTRTKRPVDDDSGDYQVYNPGSPIRQTIYNAADVQLTQEVAYTTYLSRDMTDGQIHFFTNQSASSVDISVLTAGGRAYFLKGITPSMHRVDVNPEKQNYILTAAISEEVSHTTVVPIGFQLRKGMVVNDVLVKVTAGFTGLASVSSQINLGRSGDRDGFVDGLTVFAAGYKQASPSFSTTGIVKHRYGVDFVPNFIVSSTGGADFYFKRSYLVQTAVASNNLVYSRLTAATLTVASVSAAAGRAYVFYLYDLLPVENNQ